mgnify:CR=1 FL=1
MIGNCKMTEPNQNKQILNIDELRHIAELSRVAFTEEELALLSSQLNDILNSIGELAEADTSNVEATRHISDVSNIYREDVPAESLSREQVLDNAPLSQEGYVRVRGVFDEEN